MDVSHTFVSVMVLPGNFPSAFLSLQSAHFGPALIFAAKFAIAWPFAYHLLNGVRHLAWDMGYGFKVREIEKSNFFCPPLFTCGDSRQVK